MSISPPSGTPECALRDTEASSQVPSPAPRNVDIEDRQHIDAAASGPASIKHAHQDPEENPAQHDTDATGQLVPLDFKPFFVLIEDPHTGEQYHPQVHYVFSDDDPELLTSATLAAVDPAEPDDHSAPQTILVDIDQDGKQITNISSLSAGWQASSTVIRPAPSWGDGENEEKGMVLKISGFGAPLGEGVHRENVQNLKNARDMNALLREFDDRLALSDSILGSL